MVATAVVQRTVPVGSCCRWMTEAGEEFYRYAVVVLREADQAETAIRQQTAATCG